MNLPGIRLGQNNTGTTTGGTYQGGTTTGRGGRGTIGGRTGTALGQGGLGGLNIGQQGRGGNFGNQQMQNNRQTQRRAQYATRVAFAPATPSAASSPATDTRTAVAESIAAIVPDGVQVVMEGSMAVLSGTVPSQEDRRLVERMALLEPGVRTVRNDLQVQVQGKSSSEL
jgi:hypothetical protein